MEKISYLFICLLAITSFACSSTNTQNERIIDVKEKRKTDLRRVINIRHNDTVYSNSLRCYGKLIHEKIKNKEQPEIIRKVFIAVNDIYDKTGKVYPEHSTAISDVILHAITKMNLLNVYDHDNSILRSGTNFVSGENPLHKLIKTNPTAIRELPIGIVKPAHYTISGALTQYDENIRKSFDLDLDIAGYSSRVNTTDVGIDLRLVYAPVGVVVLPEDRKILRSSSISLTNRLLSVKQDGEIFKLIGGDDFGSSFYYSINDPKYHAVRELTEHAVLELFSNLFNEPWKKHCSIFNTLLDQNTVKQPVYIKKPTPAKHDKPHSTQRAYRRNYGDKKESNKVMHR